MDIERPFHSIEKEEVLSRLEIDEDRGLSDKEARRRKKRFGPNKLKEVKEKSMFRLLFDQINNPVIYLLLAATIVSFLMGDIPEGIAITVVMVLNTIIGFSMEFKASQSMKALREMDRMESTVIRKGRRIDIDSEEVVPGDILYLEPGDIIPADARVVSSSEMKLDEAPLTGESVPVDKSKEIIPENTPLAERKNMVYKGTAMTNGKGKAVVVSTGMKTKIGDISKMVEEADEDELPLNRKLNKLTHRLIWVIGGLAGAFFILGTVMGKDLYTVFQTAVAWSIAAIPEGLPIVASIALARGMLKLAKKQVIVKRLTAVETLGETTVICTDKTGTLTENKLSVDKFRTIESQYSIGEESPSAGSKDLTEQSLDHFKKISVFCNNAQIEGEVDGDPLEVALLEFVKGNDPEYYQKLRSIERVNEDPFDSESMMMGTINRMEDSYYISSKGAAEAILERSSKTVTTDGISDMSKNDIDKWKRLNDELSAEGLRVLAYAYREVPAEENREPEEIVSDMTFLGLVGFIDPPRKNVKEAIEDCHSAGVKVVMITGDHPGTSLNIARTLDLAGEDDNVIEGKDLDKYIIEGKEIDRRFVQTPVFARVEPSHKLDIVKDFQEAGEIVGVTGDGVNDAPALKKANIGIAMGKRGTQAAREASDMVLKDDSFTSIVDAIRQGRIILGNIRKFISYQLSYHLGEILLIALISFTLFRIPLLPLQLLLLNLLSDVFPALALSVGRGDPDVMRKPPKDPEEPIVTRSNWKDIAGFGIIIAFFVTGGYLISENLLGNSTRVSNNVAFFTLALSQFWHVFNMRDDNEGILKNQVTLNKFIWGALLICLLFLFGAYFTPGLSDLLSFETLDISTWILIFALSLGPLVTIQSLKVIRYRRSKKGS